MRLGVVEVESCVAVRSGLSADVEGSAESGFGGRPRFSRHLKQWLPGEAPAVMTVDWFFVDEGNRRGPITFTTLREHWERGDLQPETLVWCRGQVDWLPLRDRVDLQEALLA